MMQQIDKSYTFPSILNVFSCLIREKKINNTCVTLYTQSEGIYDRFTAEKKMEKMCLQLKSSSFIIVKSFYCYTDQFCAT